MGLTIDTSSVIATGPGPVHVARAGRGDRALLAVTPVGERWMAAAMPDGLEDLFTIHLMELPGTGRSTLQAGTASVQTMTAAIRDVAATVEGSPILFGHSMNGALALAASRTSACSGVIAVAPPPRLPPDPGASTAYWDARADEDRRRRGRELVAAHEATTDTAQRNSLREQFDRLRRWYDLDFDPTDLDRLATIDLDWVGSVFESGRTIDWANTLRHLDHPVLLALGEFDFVAPPSAWSEDVRPPGATVHLFNRSGHTPFLEEADEFLRVTAQWLTIAGR